MSIRYEVQWRWDFAGANHQSYPAKNRADAFREARWLAKDERLKVRVLIHRCKTKRIPDTKWRPR